MKIIKQTVLSAAIFTAVIGFSDPVQAGVDPYIAEIFLVGFNYCPRGSAALNGQLLSINDNQSLFSLVGTIYGGDGRTSFGLPDLRGRVPIHTGTGPGLSPRPQGSRGGSERNTMTVGEMPSHTHRTALQTKAGTSANTTSPRFNSFADADVNMYVDGTMPQGKFIHSDTVVMENAGASQQQNNMQPYQTLNYCIAMVGTFPSRN